MLIVLAVSIFLAVLVWHEAGPVWGILVGFLLIGGLGWRLLGGLLNAVISLVMLPFLPGWYRFGRAWAHYGLPVDAWTRSSHVETAVINQNLTATRRQAYRAWRRERKRSGISAEDYVAQLARDLNTPPVRGVVRGLILTVGFWEGEALPMTDGLLVEGTRTWFEGSQRMEEPSFYQVPWGAFAGGWWEEGGTLKLKMKRGVPLLEVALQGFGPDEADRWLEALRAHGVTVTEPDSRSTDGASPDDE